MEVLKAIGKQVSTRAMSAQADVRTRVSEAGASGEALRARPHTNVTRAASRASAVVGLPRRCRRFGVDFAQCTAIAWRRRADRCMNGASGVLCCAASSRLPSAGVDRRRGAADLGAVRCDRPDPKGRRRGPSMPAATFAPGLRSRLPRLHWVWAHPAHHVCLVARPSLRRRSRRNFARRSARLGLRRPSHACATALWCRSAPWPLMCWSWSASLACRWRCRSSRS